MDEFYGPRSTDSNNRNPYKTDQPFFEPITGSNLRSGAGGPMSNSTFTKMPAEQIAHQKFTKVAQLNTQYLEHMRATNKKRKAASTAFAGTRTHVTSRQ